MSRLTKRFLPFHWKDAPSVAFTQGVAKTFKATEIGLFDPQNRVRTLTLASGTLPAGVTLLGPYVQYNGAGAVASTSFALTATDGTYTYTSSSGTATVETTQTNTPPQWTVPDGYSLGTFTTTAGGTFDLTSVATDAEGDPMVFARTGGTAPGSVTVSESGVLTVPAGLTASTYSATILLSDGVTPAGTRTFGFAVQTNTVGVVYESGFSGSPTVADGAEVTINGSGFGTKARPGPLFFDDFEGGTAGQVLGTAAVGGAWDWLNPAWERAKYDTTRAFKGTKSALIDFFGLNSIEYGSGKRVNSTEIYYSYRMYWIHQDSGAGTGVDAWNVKLGRMTPANADGVTNGTLDAGCNALGNYDAAVPPGRGQYFAQQPLVEATGVYYTYGGNPDDPPPLNKWQRIETYLKAPSPLGTPTGKQWMRVTDFASAFLRSGKYLHAPVNNTYGARSYQSEEFDTGYGLTDISEATIKHVLLPFYCRSYYDVRIWVDEVWIDDTLARFEVANNADIEQATFTAPCRATAWDDTSVTIVLNQGDQASLSGLHLFHIAASGAIKRIGRFT